MFIPINIYQLGDGAQVKALARENTTPTRAITVILYANSCISLQIG